MALAAATIDQDERAMLEHVHQKALRVPIKDAARELQALLTRRIAAYVVGVKDPKTITRWINGTVAEIKPESETRLRTAYEIITFLMRFDAPDTVHAWFIGMCPQLGDVSPAQVIHDGRLEDALYAARAFAAYG